MDGGEIVFIVVADSCMIVEKGKSENEFSKRFVVMVFMAGTEIGSFLCSSKAAGSILVSF